MARFYRTDSAMPIDYMSRINTPLMEKVLLTNDQFITNNLTELSQLNNIAGHFPYLTPDQERASAITQQYSSQIDALTEAIRKDPANWRSQLEPIRDLSNDLQRNYKTGEIAKITSNYGSYKKASDYIDKQIEQYNKTGKGISPDEGRAYKSYFLSQFKGTNYNPATGEYGVMNAYDPGNTIDIKERLSKELDKIKADKKAYRVDSVTGNEQYFNTKKQEWEGVTPQRLLSIVSDRLNDPELMSYLRDRSKVGILNNVFDEQGKLISPYTNDEVELSPQEQTSINSAKQEIAKTKDPRLKAQLVSELENYTNTLAQRRQLNWNDENSMLAPIMRGIVNEHSQSRSSESSELRNNSVWNTKYTQGQTNARQARALAQGYQIHKENREAADKKFNEQMSLNREKFEEEKWQFRNPQEKSDKKSSSSSSSSKDKKAAVDLPRESEASRYATNSFESWYTTDKNGVDHKVLSNKGLVVDIENLKKEEVDTKKQISDINNQMSGILKGRTLEEISAAEYGAYNDLRIKKQALELKAPEITSSLNSRRTWYKNSIEAALSNHPSSKPKDDKENLTKEEINLYKEFENDRNAQKIMKDIENSSLGFVFPSVNQGAYINKLTQALGNINPSDPENTKLRNKLTDYLRIKAKVDKRRDTYLESIRSTPIDTDAIQLGAEDSKAVTNMIFSNPQGLKLFNSLYEPTDKIEIDGKGINFFGVNNRKDKPSDNFGVTFTDNELLQYMAEHNVTVDVQQVGNTTKLGSGNALAKLIFKDENGELGAAPYYVELTPELQKSIGTRLAYNNKQKPEVQKIASSILDDEANNLRKQFITPSTQRTVGTLNEFEPITTTVYLDLGNQRLPLEVRKFAGSNGKDHLSVTRTNKKGEQVPLDFGSGGMPGKFNGVEDFIQQWRAYKQALAVDKSK